MLSEISKLTGSRLFSQDGCVPLFHRSSSRKWLIESFHKLPDWARTESHSVGWNEFLFLHFPSFILSQFQIICVEGTEIRRRKGRRCSLSVSCKNVADLSQNHRTQNIPTFEETCGEVKRVFSTMDFNSYIATTSTQIRMTCICACVHYLRCSLTDSFAAMLDLFRLCFWNGSHEIFFNGCNKVIILFKHV